MSTNIKVRTYSASEINDWYDNTTKTSAEFVLKVNHDAKVAELKSIIQRQAELISWLINEYPQNKDLAKIKAEFGEYMADK